MAKDDPGMGVMTVDTEAQRMMRERFGCEKPIPAATMRRSLRVQEAARLYIHHFWEMTRCAAFAGCSVGTLSKVKESDGWDSFAGLISEEIKPSIWVASDIEIPDVDMMQREKKRRIDDLESLLAEEKKILGEMAITSASSKTYSSMVSSLKSIRTLIDEATGADYYRQEQSAGRRAMMAKHIKGDTQPKDNKNPGHTGLDVS
jgi:hypothetical protein